MQTRALDPNERILSLRHANVAPHVLCQLALQQRHERSESDGLASLLRVNNNSTHHGVDAAAPHAFSRLQAQYREEASETIDGDDAHDSTDLKDRNSGG